MQRTRGLMTKIEVNLAATEELVFTARNWRIARGRFILNEMTQITLPPLHRA